MQEPNQIRVSVAAHAVAALLVSFVTSAFLPGFPGLGLGLLVLFLLGFGLQQVLGRKGMKWWLANGFFIYLLIWLVGVIYLFNLGF